ncbi:MAG: cytochrome-c peroxidase [Flavobacteriales bacterium]|nr:cytochrome-c peroxidase [Flavobacteriales bacterium]
MFNKFLYLYLLCVLGGCLLAGCRHRDPPLSARVELGQRLFFSTILSDQHTISCASCHNPKWAFADTTALPNGVRGLPTLRNAPGLFNLNRRAPYLSEGGVRTLEELIVAPLHDSLEMGSNLGHVVRRLWQDTLWLRLWLSTWDTLPSPYTFTTSLADFLRSLKSESSRADRFYRGNTAILTAQEREGAWLFTRPRLGCTRCHFGPDLTDNQFHNVGIAPKSADQGRFRLTGNASDKGKFKTPTLRNLRFTAPYMHDGSLKTLDEVFDHYASPSHPISPNDEIRQPVPLSPSEKRKIKAFLLALSDSDFVQRSVRLLSEK